MFLRTLKIHGFKSFADRSRLELEPGVTVVVGPNGSGKSNIVDAVSWVMGTQGTKHLRTTKMEEVIFAGTTTRPAHRVAEVELTFDNSERRLPLDLSEVSIARRLHRDGTSDYEINGTPCRLLDIQELLSDGGVGRHQHVIVNQGQVASILNASPEDHRAVIEEAAGVLKHRLRRQRAAARLERTKTDVSRLEDIHRELQRQMRPLRRQAKAAARHDDVRSRARALRLYLGGRELHDLAARLEAAHADDRTAASVQEQSRARLDEVEAALEELEAAAGETGRALQRDTAAAARLETTAERLQRIAQVAHERRRSLTAGAEQAEERRADLEAELDAVVADLKAAETEEMESRRTAERAEVSLRALEDEERSLAEQEALPVEGVIATLRGDLGALEAAADRDRAETAAARRRLEIVDDSLSGDDGIVAELQDEIRLADKEATAAHEVYQSARDERLVVEAEWDRLAADLVDRKQDVTAARARLEALEAISPIDPVAYERALRRGTVVGEVAQQLDIPEDLVRPVNAALGQWRDGLVTTPASLPAAVTELKAGQLGGVPFVVTTDEHGSLVAGDELPGPRLVDLLGGRANGALARRLLGDVVLADSWSAGWALVQQHPQLRAVTAEGDLVSIHGVQVAPVGGGRIEALSSARHALNLAETELARAASRESSSRRTLDEVRTSERVSLEQLEAVEVRLAGATETLGRAQRRVGDAHAEKLRLEDRTRALAEAHAHREERLVELRSRLADLEGEEAAQQAAWEALNQRRQEITRRREQSRRLREQAAAALGAATERRKLLDGRRAAVGEELSAMTAFEIDPAVVGELATTERDARSAIEAVGGHINVLRDRQAELRRTSGASVSRLEQARATAKQLTNAITAAGESRSRLAVELEGLRVRREAVAEGLRRDLDASEEAALAALEPEVPEGIDPFAHLDLLEADLRRMGPINPLAAQEYADLSERAQFLEGQLADLNESGRELEKVIRALDNEMATLFAGAFRDISALYAENFAMLFPGGKGKLRLSDDKDPLNTGVEIEAQPLGKKISQLSLLSGGERSLAAVAFLFAVFRARPSPFYVLDEVEAALDDANLRRFLRLVELLRATSQVLIVTHQQQTMEGADTLYGITMEPGGSTQVVAKRMTDLLV